MNPTDKSLKTACSSRAIGIQAEENARIFLEKSGLKFITANYHARSGEIDLIMADNDYLVFVEVRSRQKMGYGDSLESITKSKRRRIISAANSYLLEKKLTDKVACRFDVVAFNIVKEREETIWIKDAFWVK